MPNCERPLARVVETSDGKTKLKTLDQARAFVLEQRDHNEWDNGPAS
jgi:hypothetical protein